MIQGLLRRGSFSCAFCWAHTHAEPREFKLTIDDVTISVAPGFNGSVFDRQ